MSAVVNANRLTPFSQVEQLFSSLASLLSSIVESTESAFRRVHVMKKDANGSIKFYDVKETVVDASGHSTQGIRKVNTLTYIEDIKSGDLYLAEDAYIVSVKCACLVLGILFYAASKMGWYVVKTPLEIGVLATDMIVKVGKLLLLCKCSEASAETSSGVSRISETLGTGIFEIAKAPLFAVGCEIAAIYGIFRPYYGRKFEAFIENAWQHGASYREDLRKVPARDGENCWTAFTKDILDSHPFYLAHCFQARGNVNDSRVIVKDRTTL